MNNIFVLKNVNSFYVAQNTVSTSFIDNFLAGNNLFGKLSVTYTAAGVDHTTELNTELFSVSGFPDAKLSFCAEMVNETAVSVTSIGFKSQECALLNDTALFENATLESGKTVIYSEMSFTVNASENVEILSGERLVKYLARIYAPTSVKIGFCQGDETPVTRAQCSFSTDAELSVTQTSVSVSAQIGEKVYAKYGYLYFDDEPVLRIAATAFESVDYYPIIRFNCSEAEGYDEVLLIPVEGQNDNVTVIGTRIGSGVIGQISMPLLFPPLSARKIKCEQSGSYFGVLSAESLTFYKTDDCTPIFPLNSNFLNKEVVDFAISGNKVCVLYGNKTAKVLQINIGSAITELFSLSLLNDYTSAFVSSSGVYCAFSDGEVTDIYSGSVLCRSVGDNVLKPVYDEVTDSLYLILDEQVAYINFSNASSSYELRGCTALLTSDSLAAASNKHIIFFGNNITVYNYDAITCWSFINNYGFEEFYTGDGLNYLIGKKDGKLNLYSIHYSDVSLKLVLEDLGGNITDYVISYGHVLFYREGKLSRYLFMKNDYRATLLGCDSDTRASLKKIRNYFPIGNISIGITPTIE